MKKSIAFLLVSLIIIADQWSKHWAQLSLLPYQAKPLAPFVNFTLAYNSGAAFSFLSDSGSWHRWFFTVFSGVMSIILAMWIIRLPKKATLQGTALSLILGGALGNLYDRAFSGQVIDFIDLYFKNYHWPVFNIADSAICLGAFLLVLDLCKNPSRQRA